MIGKNPFEDADLPKREKKVRAIWTADIIRQALDSCQDGKLYIAINLAFACSMRMGEIPPQAAGRKYSHERRLCWNP